MGEFFNYSLFDVLSHPVLKITGGMIKKGGQVIYNQMTKSKYEENKGVPNEQVKLLDQAEAGDADAQFRLGRFYAEVKDDEITAMYWILKAVKNGNQSAREMLEHLQAQ